MRPRYTKPWPKILDKICCWAMLPTHKTDHRTACAAAYSGSCQDSGRSPVHRCFGDHLWQECDLPLLLSKIAIDAIWRESNVQLFRPTAIFEFLKIVPYFFGPNFFFPRKKISDRLVGAGLTCSLHSKMMECIEDLVVQNWLAARQLSSDERTSWQVSTMIPIFVIGWRTNE